MGRLTSRTNVAEDEEIKLNISDLKTLICEVVNEKTEVLMTESNKELIRLLTNKNTVLDNIMEENGKLNESLDSQESVNTVINVEEKVTSEFKHLETKNQNRKKQKTQEIFTTKVL